MLGSLFCLLLTLWLQHFFYPLICAFGEKQNKRHQFQQNMQWQLLYQDLADSLCYIELLHHPLQRFYGNGMYLFKLLHQFVFLAIINKKQNKLILLFNA